MAHFRSNYYGVQDSCFVNLSTKEGKAVVEVLLPFGEMVPMQEIISDANFADTVAACGAKK